MAFVIDGPLRFDAEGKMTLIQLAQLLFDTEQVGVVITDAHHCRPGPTILYANAAFSALAGRSIPEILGLTPRFMQGRETRRASLDAFAEALASGRRFHGFLTNYRGDGQKYQNEIDCRPLCRSDGQVDLFIAFEREVARRLGRPAASSNRYDPVLVSNDMLSGTLKALGAFSSGI